jgi:predicted ATPase/DNA-binding SARP family transcriptional activator
MEGEIQDVGLELVLLGGLAVHARHGVITDFGSRQARTLLAILALSEGAIHRNVLASLLWPGDPMETSRPRLRTEIYRLRESLGPASEIVISHVDTLSIDRAIVRIDSETISALIRKAGTSTSETKRLSELRHALTLIKGPLLPHETSSWFDAVRTAWNELGLKAFEEAARLEMSMGRVETSIELCRRALSLYSDRPALISLTMECLVAAGDLPEALATFDRYAERLQDDFDLEPSQDLIRFAADLRRRSHQEPRASNIPIATASSNLPPKTADIFGREEIIEKLVIELEPDENSSDSRKILNFHGPGGVGKTTLALEVARRIEQAYGGRVYFVPLATIVDLNGLKTAIAHELGVTLDTKDDVDGIVTRLKGKPSLLVLDNIEQLVPLGSRFLAEVFQRVPRLRLVTTSRCSLELSLERRVPILPLPTAHAAISGATPAPSLSTELFIDRARRILPDYRPDAQELQDIEQVAQHLQGLPLALVLAAARIAILSPREILRDIASLVKVRSVNHDVEERHRSLGLTIEWSLGLLSVRDRTVLERLVVFRRDASVAAAQAIVGSEALEALDSLVAQSLVTAKTHPGGTRFEVRLLVREYIIESIGGLADSLRQRHAEYFAERVRSAYPGRLADQEPGGALIEHETENIDAALTWLEHSDRELYCRTLVGMTRFWCVRQNERRAADWLNNAAAKGSEFEPELIADLSYSAARLLLIAGRYDEAEERNLRASAIYGRLDDQPALLSTLRVQALLAFYRSDFPGMQTHCQSAIVVAERLGDRLALANLLSDLGLAQANLGLGEDSLRSFQKCIPIHEERNDLLRRTKLRSMVASTLLTMRKWTEAEQILLDVIQATEDGNFEAIRTQCLAHLTTVCIRTGRLVEAEEYLQAALAPTIPTVHSFIHGVLQYLSVLLSVHKRDRRATARASDRLVKAWSSVSSKPTILPIVDVIAYALASFGCLEQARRLLDESDAMRLKLSQVVSPHYSVTYEEARALVGPRQSVTCPETCEALFESARNALWLL